MTGSTTPTTALLEVEFGYQSDLLSWSFDSGLVAVGQSPTQRREACQAEVHIISLHRPSQRVTLFVPLKGEV